MPRTKRATHAPRRSKPKFEIPVETGLPKAPVGWVYRAEEPKQHDSETNPFVAAAMEVFFFGVKAAFGLMVAPIRIAKGMMDSDK